MAELWFGKTAEITDSCGATRATSTICWSELDDINKVNMTAIENKKQNNSHSENDDEK